MKRLVLLTLLSLCLGKAGFGQGCSQCRESVGQTPVKTQRAYEHGILVLLAAVGIVCGATGVVIRKFR